MPRKASANAPDWLAGDGELVCLIRDKDWSASPLGPIGRWPQSLRTAVGLCLASNFPINIIWGPEHSQIYNDSYRLCCGDAHPRSLGENYRQTWASAWPAIGESFDRALAGETMYLENQRMFLKRLGGALEETFFTFSHSPIRDESGGIAGLFHPVTETTATMLAERRTRALRDLSASLAAAGDEAEVARRTAEIVARFEFDLPFVLYYAFDPASARYLLAASHGMAPGTRAAPVSFEPGDGAPWPFAEALNAARTVEVEGLAPILRGVPCGPYEEPPDRALVIPIVVPSAERPPALMIAAASPRLRFNDDYRSFYHLLGVTVGSALAVVRAREDERRRAEALAEIDRAKTLFFSNVSHEFRTPLTLMLGPLGQALDFGDELAPRLREELTVVHRNALRLQKLVNTLLDFSRIESGRIQASYEACDLASLTAELASNFRSATERAGVRLVVDCPVLPEPVWIDREMWEKIVLNLLSNAFKFTFEGEIVVRLSQQDPHFTELIVSDTGVGIGQADLPHLFERFHRIRGARARSHEGSGIGLALTQELVKLHAGTIAVSSTPGKGTTFTVRIPTGTAHLRQNRLSAVRSQTSTAISPGPFVEEALRWLPNASGAVRTGNSAESAPARPVQSGSHNVKILVADDNADMRDYVARLLAVEYDVETAPDGDVALQAARARTPDLVLADIMMPGLDGLGLLRELRADERTSHVPVILLSARAGEESTVEGLDAGADDYLVKPFTSRELLARVKAHVILAQERRRAAKALNERLADLQKANGDIRDARRATLNVLEDAVEARNRAEGLYGELCEYADWIHGQREALEAAINEAPLEESLGALIRTATAAMGPGTRAAIYLANEEGTTLHHIVGMSAEYARVIDGFRIGPESLACGLATHTGEPVLTVDVREDPRWEPWRWLAERFGYRGCWSFPVNTTAHKLVGSLAIYSPQPREAARRELQLASLLTNTASIILSRYKEAEVRKQAEAALRKSEEQLRAYLAASFDVVYRMSADWSVMRRLEGKAFISDTTEPSGEWLDKYIHPEDQTRVMEAITRAIQSKSVFELEHRVRSVDGTLAWTVSRAIPLLDERGEILEWLGTATNVTARRGEDR
jgi:signal transduction histidine kinase/DNA-binding response OmpR family regulator